MPIIIFFLLIYCYFYSLYFLIFAIASLFKAREISPEAAYSSFLILIPAYKEDQVIVNNVKELLKHDYPKDKFDILVIADSFSEITLKALNELPIRVIQVNFEFSTKSKSINKALALDSGHDYKWILILDADNKLEQGCLKMFNNSLSYGYSAVQGHRTANEDTCKTAISVLDAISEEINNNIFRKGHRLLGLSSALIGSGMCFDFSFYKQMMQGLSGVGSEDEGLELKIFLENQKIEYLDQCFIYDEKVSNAKIFGKQRIRWIAGQFHYLKHSLKNISLFWRDFNPDLFDKYLQKLIIPRLFYMLLVPSIAIFAFLYKEDMMFYTSLLALTLFIVANAIAIPKRFYQLKYIPVILELPKAIFYLFKESLGIGKALKSNYHTPHGTINNDK